MEENKFDPLQFIGFLLISAILMFWFYDNQSSYVENQQDIVVENPIEKFEDNSNTLNLAKEDSNKVELDKKFKEEIITLENDKILFEISTSGADINKLLLKDFSNYNDQPLFLVNDNKSIFSYNIPIGRNSIINSRDLNYSAEIIKDKSILKLTAVIDSQRSLELTYSLEENSSILDFDLRLNDSDRNSTYDQLELVWGKDSFRNSKSIDYENRYTALSYGFEDEKDSYLSVAGTKNKNINNHNEIRMTTALHVACLNNQYESVKYLLEKLNMDVNYQDRTGSTPLMYAAWKGNFKIVKYLINKHIFDSLSYTA